VIWLILGISFACVGTIVLVARMASRPTTVLYALALVVSIVGINIHYGVTIYLSRVVLFLFLIALIVRSAVGHRCGLQLKFLSRFISIFALILLVQLISVLLSSQVSDGLRQMFIYMSMMALFSAVVVIGSKPEAIIKAIKVYLAIGVVQGLYGIYQVIGAPMSWPTYQTFMAGIPTANDRLTEGFFYSGSFQSFRATGFFPADVSQYAGYMAGVLLLAISLMANNWRSRFSYVVIAIAGAGFVLSLSRSGYTAFIAVGIPSILLVRWRARLNAQNIWRPFFILVSLLVVVGVSLSLDMTGMGNIDFQKIFAIMSSRYSDVLNPGISEVDSMELHIISRLLAIDAWASSPLLGVGLGVNASPWYSERYQEFWGGAHSHHLDILGQTGLLGACLQWTFMGFVALYMWRGLIASRHNSEGRNVLAGILSTYITIILGNFFYHYYLSDFVWFLMGCGVALSRGIQREQIAPANVEVLLAPRVGVASSHVGKSLTTDANA
jgi:hypothetical protein